MHTQAFQPLFFQMQVHTLQSWELKIIALNSKMDMGTKIQLRYVNGNFVQESFFFSFSTSM